MNTIHQSPQGLTKRPSTALVKLAAKDRAALQIAHREIEAVDSRLAALAKLKTLRAELDEIPALYAAGKIGIGEAVRSSPAGLNSDVLHSIRGILTSSCKALSLIHI
jgi:hypothetical protein